MVVLNIRVIEQEDVTIIRGIEFPNVIVQGKTFADAKTKFQEALNHFFLVRAKIESEKYPLQSQEKEATLRIEFVPSE